MGRHDTQKHSMKLEWSGYPLYPEDVKDAFPEDELWALRYLFFYGNHKSPLLPVNDDADYLINLLAVVNSIYKKYQNTPTNHIFDTFSSTLRHAIEYKTKTLTGETIHNLAKHKLQQDSKDELQHLYVMATLFFKIALKHEPEAYERLNKSINRYLMYYCDLNKTTFDPDKTDELFIEICQKLQIYLSPKKVEERIGKSEEYMGYKNLEQQAKHKRTAANLALACVTKELNILQNPQTVSDEEDVHFASEASDTASSDDSLSGDEKKRAKNQAQLSSEPSSDNIAKFAKPDSKASTLRRRHIKTQNS
ncbi:MAG: hypothetical protein KAS93_02925, partial [Gammaproteobacteria bacterium]|nr:hypothetical protein [Gammaproteobacteria bacterium]